MTAIYKEGNKMNNISVKLFKIQASGFGDAIKAIVDRLPFLFLALAVILFSGAEGK